MNKKTSDHELVKSSLTDRNTTKYMYTAAQNADAMYIKLQGCSGYDLLLATFLKYTYAISMLSVCL
jgi:hypothetical protein